MQSNYSDGIQDTLTIKIVICTCVSSSLTAPLMSVATDDGGEELGPGTVVRAREGRGTIDSYNV